MCDVSVMCVCGGGGSLIRAAGFSGRKETLTLLRR